MAHSHSSPDSHATKQLILAAGLCFVFMIVEIVGGYFAHSLAIMTDAAHLLSDFVSFGISIFAIWISKRKATPSMTFGYHRAEIIGALLSILMIWMLTGVLCYEAVHRLFSPVMVDGKLLFLIASIGVIVNLSIGLTLHQGSHFHTHSLDEVLIDALPQKVNDELNQLKSLKNNSSIVLTDEDVSLVPPVDLSAPLIDSNDIDPNSLSQSQLASHRVSSLHVDPASSPIGPEPLVFSPPVPISPAREDPLQPQVVFLKPPQPPRYDRRFSKFHSPRLQFNSQPLQSSPCESTSLTHKARSFIQSSAQSPRQKSPQPHQPESSSTDTEVRVLSRAELAELDHGYESDSEQEAEYAADRTHGHSHSHAHRQLRSSSMPTHPTKELSGSVKLHRQQQVNVRAAFIHVLGDLVQSVGVMIAGLVIWLRPQWHIADPICTLLFAVLVIVTTWNILQETIHVLMEGAPASVDLQQLTADLMQLPGVLEVHDLHLWQMSVDKKLSLSAHIQVDLAQLHVLMLPSSSNTGRDINVPESENEPAVASSSSAPASDETEAMSSSEWAAKKTSSFSSFQTVEMVVSDTRGLLQRAQLLLRTRYGVSHTALQLEYLVAAASSSAYLANAHLLDAATEEMKKSAGSEYQHSLKCDDHFHAVSPSAHMAA